MSKIKRFTTSYLFPLVTAKIGFGSSISIFGNYFEFNSYSSPQISDARAIQNDWSVVGEDFKVAFDQ